MDIQQISQQYDIPEPELEKLIEKTKKGLLVFRKRYTDEQFEQYVLNAVTGKLEGQKASGVEKFFGIVLIWPQPRDLVAKQRAEALKTYLKTPEDAVQNGVVQEIQHGIIRKLDKSGKVTSTTIRKDDIPASAIHIEDKKVWIVPTDSNPKFKSGKDNFNYLKPLPSYRWSSLIEGIATQDGETYKAFDLWYNYKDEEIRVIDDKAFMIKCPVGKLTQFQGIHRSNEDTQNKFVIRQSKRTKFEVLPDSPEPFYETILEFYGSTTIQDIDELFDPEEVSFDIIAIEGIAQQVWKKEATAEEPFTWGTIKLSDNISERVISVLCHPSIPLNFEPGSPVKVFGTLSEGNVYDSELKQVTDEKEVTMFASGLFVFGNETNEETEESVEEPTEEISEDWD